MPAPAAPQVAPKAAPKPATVSGPVAVVEDAAQDRRGPLRPGRLISTRERMRGETLSALFRTIDALVIAGSAWLVYDLLSPVGVWSSTVGQAAPYLASAVLLIYGLALVEAYGFRAREPLAAHLARTGGAFALTAAILAAILALARAPKPLTEGLVAWFAFSFATVYMLHAWWWLSVRQMRRSGRLIPNVVVVGATENAERLIAQRPASAATSPCSGCSTTARPARAESLLHGVPFLGDTSALIGHRIMPYVDRVVITVSSTAQTRVRALVDKLRVLPNDITLFVDLGGKRRRDRDA